MLNAAGALVWAAAIASGGYFFGRALEVLIGKLKSYEIYIYGQCRNGWCIDMDFPFLPSPQTAGSIDRKKQMITIC